MLYHHLIEKEILLPPAKGVGKSMRIIVSFIVYGNGFPDASRTYSILKPPSKPSSRYLRENPATLIASSALVFCTSGVFDVFALMFWSSCTHKYSSDSCALLWYVMVSTPLILVFLSSSSISIL